MPFNLLKPTVRLGWELLFDLGRRDYYGQFGEDAFLQGYFVRKQWLKMKRKSRLFSAARRLPPGFYVDIGAYSPKLFSNTYWFYRQGWHGINIDATPGSMRAFRLIRPRDINLELAVSDRAGELPFYSWGTSSVLNTPIAGGIDERSMIQGKTPESIPVPARPLSDILADILPVGQSIDFLSVDVEGYEEPVIRSNDWTRFRPELVLVEQYGDTVEEMMTSNVSQFMHSVDYAIYAWLKPNMIYVDQMLSPMGADQR